MTEHSGRELEIAVAKALGWRVEHSQYGNQFVVIDGIGKQRGWVNGDAPDPERWLFDYDGERYLTDPVAFASVLAALWAEPWHQVELLREQDGSYSARLFYGENPLHWDCYYTVGDTFEEAVCRAVVAWKEATHA